MIKTSDVTLMNVLNNDKETCEMVKTNLTKNGWCFVKFNDRFNSLVQKIAKNMSDFFNMDGKIKEKYSYEYNTGYFQTPTKDHFRILTGSYALPELKVDQTQHKTEINMNKSSIALSKLMDRIMTNMTTILSNDVFHLTKEQQNSLTIAGQESYKKALMQAVMRGIPREDDHENVEKFNWTGLLDIVRYKPNIKDKEYYVSEHVDPGLFSLNIYSDSNGMQFYDYSINKWVDLPQGYGVIFCGQAATIYSKIPAARHRVLNNNKGRFSIWYEVGVKSQIQPKYKITKKRLEQPIQKKMMDVDVYFNSSSRTKSFKVPVDGTLLNIKKQLEIGEGIPISKSISHVRPISKQDYSQDDVKIGDTKHWRATRDGFLVKRENDYGSYAPFN